MSSSSPPPPSSSSSSLSVPPSEPPSTSTSTSTTTPTSSENRNTEIWSTRLQRELLVMTTDNASEGAKKEMNAVLPSFCVVKDHSLDIERGNCTVTCVLDCVPNLFIFNAPPPKSSNSTTGTEENTEEKEGAKNTTNETKSEEDEVQNNDSTESEKKKKEDDDEGKTMGKQPSSPNKESNDAVASTPPISTPISITLDVSLKKKSDGVTVDAAAVSYPFLKPIATLTSGCDNFPKGSTIKDGDNIDIEMDWTPSLHLTDAILYIALTIKESLSQGEVVHPGTTDRSSNSAFADDETVKANFVNRAKKLGSSFGFSLRNLTESTTSKNNNNGGGGGGIDNNNPSSTKKASSRLSLGRKKKAKKAVRTKATPSKIGIGDEINMLEAPWVNCQGVYSCKAIRRPKFVDEAIAKALPKETEHKNQLVEEENESKTSQVANVGFAGAGAMLRSFTNSARGVLEESFLMITENHIIEMRSNKLNLSTGTVTFAIPIEVMSKLKFRRQESLSLFFKPAPEDPLIYMCPDSADCVHQIQAVLKRHGVKGKHTNAGTHRAINQALHFIQEIQTKELALKHDPSIDRVNEIMDLYRQAAERFEVAGDVRHEQVVTHMRKFLALSLTASLLDGSYEKSVDDAEPISTTTGEGVVLPAKVEVQDKKEDRKFEDNMDNLLAEAEADLANMKSGEDDPELDAMLDADNIDGGSADDAIADFENMLKEADDELAELMSS
mmetsp:Transcript_35862/g.41189  ORF Transcript_35862/g.41189 Transcript_35862/m.41189 type:complete len:724 (+) Transcript_35862:145-2316(+)